MQEDESNEMRMSMLDLKRLKQVRDKSYNGTRHDQQENTQDTRKVK